MKRTLILSLTTLFFAVFTASALPQADTTRVDTLQQIVVRGDTTLRVNEAIRQSIKNNGTRIGTMSVSDVIGAKMTDKILHPFAVKDRKREKKHARDRQILENYDEQWHVKTFEELLDEAIHKQAIEDGKEPPTGSGKK